MTETKQDARLLRWLVAVFAAVGIFLALDMQRLFGTQFTSVFITLESHYLFALLALLLSPVFFIFPGRLPMWLNGVFSLACMIALGYLFAEAERGLDEGWEFGAPVAGVVAATVLWVLILEALRRVSGWGLFAIAGVFSIYPMFADVMPGPLLGLAATPAETAAYHGFSIESIFGLPFRAYANLVIGFLVFGVALQRTGGGQFFIDLAFALLGRVRGGPAKVAVVASGLMGSMSGSVITNVVTTGQLTIPTMIRSGFAPRYAAGVEACASTGGVLLPPIMGSTAFVMATFLEVPYVEVALAATIPAVLYFLGLFLQVDAYAAREKLGGVAADLIQPLGQVLLKGWYYLFSFATLIVLLLVMQREAQAPYVATAVLLVVNQLSSTHRWGWSDVLEFFYHSGRLLAELAAVLAGVGLIVGALSVTGVSGTLINDLLYLAGGSVFALLALGAFTSFVLGIGMTVTAAYIFLAIVLAPALIEGGLNPMAVHLFILYWGMLSFITPPVALGAFAAASIAGASPMRTGFTAMALGSVVYLIPFLFVLDPAFIFEGAWYTTVERMVRAAVGLALVAGAVQGYVLGLGGGWPRVSRVLLAVSGVAIALPDLPWSLAWSANDLLVAGFVGCGLAWVARKTLSGVAATDG